MTSHRVRRLATRKVTILIGIGAAALIAPMGITPSAGAEPFAAEASVSPTVQYLGDSTGTTFTFTVENTGTVDSIGAVEIGRPGKLWRIIECPSAPPGWSEQRSDTVCRFRSEMGTDDDIHPGQESSDFQVTATVPPGTQNLTGIWSVKVSRSSLFDKKSKLLAAAAEPPGLDITAYSFQVLDAVVDPVTSTPGAPCPAASKSAITGSTGHTIVICGRNRTTGTLTPTAAQSSLGGTFVAGSGTFSSGAVAPTESSVVLGTWTNVPITSLAGPGKTVIAKIGSARNRTSPLTTLTGYEALNNPPDAVDDDEATDEDNPVSFDPRTNDSDPDGDPFTVTATDTTGTAGSVTITGGGTGLTYDPDGQFDHLAVGEQATDTFTYTVSDTFGASDSATVTVTVTGVNDDPGAVDDETAAGEDSGGAVVDVLANDTDPDASDTLSVTVVNDTGTSGVVTNNGTDVTYDPDGQFDSLAAGETATDTFTYDVSDGNGGNDTATVTITINGANDAPTAVDDSGAGFSGPADAAFTTGSVLTNDTDPDASDTLSVQGLDQSGTQGTVTDNGDGTFGYDPAGAFDDLPGGDTASDLFSYTVTDGNGGTDTATVTITITGANHAPNAVADEKTVGEDSAGAPVDVLANDTDPDSDSLSVTSVDTTGTAGQVTNNGTDVTYDANGQFESLAVGETDTDTFTYTVSDGNGGTDTATVTVTITGANDAPTAVDDETTVGEDSTGTTVNVLGNDTDPDTTDVLSVTSIDETGTTGDVSLVGGVVTYNPNGQFESLAAGETDTDTFTYTVSDGNGGTDTATVTVTITGANDAPTAVDDDKTVGKDDPATLVDVLANDTDAEGDTLSVTSVDTTGTLGSVTNNGSDVSYDPNGQFDGLEAGDTATDTFTYTVSDGNGGTDTATVTITVTGANAPPNAVDDTETAGEDDTGTTVDVLANDTDANGDTLLVTSVDTTGTAGTVTNNGLDVTYDPNGQFESLAAGETDTDTFTYTVSDGTDTDTATVTITITGANDAPTAVDDSTSVGEDSTGTTISVRANDTDPDTSDTLTVSAVDTTGTVGTVTITNAGADVSYDPNGEFNFLGVGESATDTFTYTVSDGNGGTDIGLVSVTITGANDAPTAVDDSGTTDEDTTLNVTAPGVLANDTDPDTGDTKTVTKLNGTATLTGTSTEGAAVTINANGSYTYDPGSIFQGLSTGQSDTDTFSYTMQDGSGAESTATVTVTIDGLSDAPTAVADSFNVIGNTGLFVGTTVPASQAGKVISGSLLANDTDPDTPHASLVAEPVTNAPTTLGGTITIESDGSFTYHPDDGDTSVTDTFTYRVCDSSPCDSGTVANSTGTLSLPIAGQVWYVENNQSAGGDGTSDTPFDTLVEAETASGAGDTVYVFDGDNTTTNLDTGYVMETDERLIGESRPLSLDPDGGGPLPTSLLRPSTDGAQPTLTASNEDVIVLASNTLVNGFDIDPSGTGGGISGGAGTADVTVQNVNVTDIGTAGTQPGIELDGTTGVSRFTGVTVTNGGSATAIGVRINNAGSVLFASTATNTIATSGAKALDASNTNLLNSRWNDITVTGSGTGGIRLSSTTGAPVLGDGAGSDLSLTTTGGAGLHVNNATNVSVGAAGTDNVQSTGGPALDITGAGTYAFDLVDSTNSPGSGIILMNIGAGTVDIDDGTIAGYTAWGLNHSGGSGNVDIGADINDGAGVNVSVLNRSGGSVIFTGAIADSGDAGGGAWASNNSNTTIRFEGGVSLSTGTGDAFFVSSTGTVVVTDANGPGVAPDNTVTSTTGRAVVITGTTIGADGVAFRSISSNGATNGIVLNNTGSSGGLTVTGNGGACATTGDACTGGTIQSTTGDAISLSSTRGVVLNRMKIVNSLGNGIRGSGVTNFGLRDSVVDNNGDNAASDEAGVHLTNLAGTSDITRTLVANSPEDNARIVNSSGTLSQLNVTDSVFRDTDTLSPGNNGLLIQADGGSITADVVGSTFLRNRANGLQVITNGTGSMDIEVDDSGTAQSTFDDNNIGVNIAHNSSGSFAFDVRDLTIDGLNVAAGTGGSASPINLNLAGSATTTMSGTVAGNTLTNSNSTTGPGIRMIGNGNATMTVLVDSNNISQVANRGIETIARDGSNRINATITNNTVNLTHALAGDAIRVDAGAVSTDTTTICADIRGNTATTAAVGLFDIRVRQRFAGTSFILEDYAGAPNDDAAVQTFLATNNNGATTSADHAGAGFTSTADCPMPS